MSSSTIDVKRTNKAGLHTEIAFKADASQQQLLGSKGLEARYLVLQ